MILVGGRRIRGHGRGLFEGSNLALVRLKNASQVSRLLAQFRTAHH